jgi:hypothetical protein
MNNLYILAFSSIGAQEIIGMFEQFDQIKENIEIANWIRQFCEDRFVQVSRNDGDCIRQFSFDPLRQSKFDPHLRWLTDLIKYKAHVSLP